MLSLLLLILCTVFVVSFFVASFKFISDVCATKHLKSYYEDLILNLESEKKESVEDDKL